jgi:hypothetical protein
LGVFHVLSMGGFSRARWALKFRRVQCRFGVDQMVISWGIFSMGFCMGFSWVKYGKTVM